MMADYGNGRIAWEFYDGVTEESYLLPINPNECSIPSVVKTTVSQPTAAGGRVVFGGRSQPRTLNFGGTILEEEHYRALQGWVEMRKQIRITDDLSRSYWVYILAFEPSRQRDIAYPWRMNYTATAVILDWGST